MVTIAGVVVCFALGLYAGKKRAFGSGWWKIARDFVHDSFDIASGVWKNVSSPFRKGRGKESQEVVEAEIVDAA